MGSIISQKELACQFVEHIDQLVLQTMAEKNKAP